MNKAFNKYLATAASETAKRSVVGHFAHVVVIPAYGENHELWRAIQSIPSVESEANLIVLVINQRDDSPSWVKEENRAALARLATLESENHLLVVGRNRLLVLNEVLPRGEGVGLARKLGADLAAALILRDGSISSRWIHCTDADAIVAQDYFSSAQAAPPAAVAAIHPFWHHGAADERLARAMRRYELSLRYYVLGLARAGSRWAFHTIGSTLAIDAQAYVAVRGFPRRDAAEDFYLLSKVAKLGAVMNLVAEPIQLDGRVSHRVPFGTGAALAKLSATDDDYLFYHPSVFDRLAEWLHYLVEVVRLGSLPVCPPTLVALAQHLGAEAAITSALDRSNSAAVLTRHLHTWFDAWLTLKLIHYARDHGAGLLDYRSALAATCELGAELGAEDDETMRRQLVQLELARVPRTVGMNL